MFVTSEAIFDDFKKKINNPGYVFFRQPQFFTDNLYDFGFGQDTLLFNPEYRNNTYVLLVCEESLYPSGESIHRKGWICS